nr:metalloregulator ArsR/SmtB family transcription factor [Corynebacterium ulcerans]
MNSPSNKAQRLFSALADPMRIRILYLVAEHREGMNRMEITSTLGIAAPVLAQHMAKLAEANLICTHKDGKRISYHVVPEEFARVQELFLAINANPRISAFLNRPRS